DRDPPPWLRRMRELGYPPGYLGYQEEEKAEVKGQEPAAGAEKASKEEGEDTDSEAGEIPAETNAEGKPVNEKAAAAAVEDPNEFKSLALVLDDASEEGSLDADGDGDGKGGRETTPEPEPFLVPTVEFPGLNAPPPEGGDEYLWGGRGWRADWEESERRRRLRTGKGIETKEGTGARRGEGTEAGKGAETEAGKGAKTGAGRGEETGAERGEGTEAGRGDGREAGRGEERRVRKGAETEARREDETGAGTETETEVRTGARIGAGRGSETGAATKRETRMRREGRSGAQLGLRMTEVLMREEREAELATLILTGGSWIVTGGMWAAAAHMGLIWSNPATTHHHDDMTIQPMIDMEVRVVLLPVRLLLFSLLLRLPLQGGKGVWERLKTQGGLSVLVLVRLCCHGRLGLRVSVAMMVAVVCSWTRTKTTIKAQQQEELSLKHHLQPPLIPEQQQLSPRLQDILKYHRSIRTVMASL
ncbi:unnamed protein product, partial [Closterium sp. Naga37s-1]